MTKARATPRKLKMVPMAVAVVLSLGGNHTADRMGGAAMATGPPRPFSIWPTCVSLQRAVAVFD